MLNKNLEIFLNKGLQTSGITFEIPFVFPITE